MRFVNPAGFSPGSYPARILNTGEVVPYIPVPVACVHANDGIVLTWADTNSTLQVAASVTGPWTNVAGAMSPYTNQFADGPQEFFRLQQ